MWLPRISVGRARAPWQVLLTALDWKLYLLQHSAYCKNFQIAKRHFIISIVIVSYHGATADSQSSRSLCASVARYKHWICYLLFAQKQKMTSSAKKVTHLPHWNCHIWTEIRGRPTVQSPGGTSPHCCVSVFLQTLYTSSAPSEWIRAALDGEQRREKTNKPSVSLACLTVTPCLHSQSKQHYLKHEASSSPLSSSGLTELELLSSVWTKINKFKKGWIQAPR